MEAKTAFLIITALIASGCASSSPESGAGVKIEEFTITDQSLTPNQQANLRVQVANLNKNPTKVNVIEIYNEGEMKLKDKQCSQKSLRAARKNLKPRMECSWTVKAPENEFLQGFDEKPAPLNLRIIYQTQFENNEPFKLEYKELSEISKSSKKSKEFSNGEIKIRMEGETPTTKSNPSPLDIKIQNTGNGKIIGNYKLDYTPKSILENCPSSKEPVIDKTAEISCTPNQGATGSKNLFITTGYKYTKTKTKSVKVVSE